MSVVKTLTENIEGRDFVIGDLHGSYHLLDHAISRINFNPEIDRIISVGDLINKGPQSMRCLEFLKKPWFYAVRGNHEDLFINSYSCKRGIDNIKSKFAINNQQNLGWTSYITDEYRRELYEEFMKLPIIIEIPDNGMITAIIHGEVPIGMSWNEFKDNINFGDEDTINSALCSRDRFNQNINDKINGIDRIFCGHTPQRNGVKKLGNCFYIDTGAVYKSLSNNNISGNSLTVADVNTSDSKLLLPNINNGVNYLLNY